MGRDEQQVQQATEIEIRLAEVGLPTYATVLLLTAVSMAVGIVARVITEVAWWVAALSTTVALVVRGTTGIIVFWLLGVAVEPDNATDATEGQEE